MRFIYKFGDLVVLAVQDIEESCWEAEDTWLVFLHFRLVYKPPSIHDYLVFDGVHAVFIVSEINLPVIHWDEVGCCEDEVHGVPDGLVLDTGHEPVVQGFFLVRAEPAEGGGNKVLVEEGLPGEDVIPEYAYLEIPGVRDSVGCVDLSDDLLSLEGCVANIEQVGHVRVVLHVLPVVDVELNHLAVHLAQV